MDGLLIGITFIAGSLTSGLMMGFALAIEMCFLGISTRFVIPMVSFYFRSAMIKKKHVSKWLGIPICAVLPLLIMISGCIGASILSRLSGPRNVNLKNNF